MFKISAYIKYLIYMACRVDQKSSIQQIQSYCTHHRGHVYDHRTASMTWHWYQFCTKSSTLQWRHNGRDCVSNHQPYDRLLNCLFRRRSEKSSKLRVTGLCEGNSQVIGEFPAQRASNAEMFPFDDVIIDINDIGMEERPQCECSINSY